MGHEPDTDQDTDQPTHPKRRPTGPLTAAVAVSKADIAKHEAEKAKVALKLAEIGARAENARRDDSIAMLREGGAQLRALLQTAFDGLAKLLPTKGVIAILVFGALGLVLGLAAIVYNRAFVLDGLGIGVGIHAESTPHGKPSKPSPPVVDTDG